MPEPGIAIPPPLPASFLQRHEQASGYTPAADVPRCSASSAALCWATAAGSIMGSPDPW
jgi:hypothetical protein